MPASGRSSTFQLDIDGFRQIMNMNISESVEGVLKTVVGEATKELTKSALSDCISVAVASVAASATSSSAAQLTVVLLRALIGTAASSEKTLRALFSEPLETGVAEAFSCFEIHSGSPQDRAERRRRLDAADDRLAVALTLSRTGAQKLNNEILINLLRGLIAIERGAHGFGSYHLTQAEASLRTLEIELEKEWKELRHQIFNQPQLAMGGIRLEKKERELNERRQQASAFRVMCEQLRIGPQ